MILVDEYVEYENRACGVKNGVIWKACVFC